MQCCNSRERYRACTSSCACRSSAAVVETKEQPLTDAWAQPATQVGFAPEEHKLARRPSRLGEQNRPQIAAVEVEPAGCSYNPDRDHHQEALAAAVAVEVTAQLDRDLEPQVCVCVPSCTVQRLCGRRCELLNNIRMRLQ